MPCHGGNGIQQIPLVRIDQTDSWAMGLGVEVFKLIAKERRRASCQPQ